MATTNTTQSGLINTVLDPENQSLANANSTTVGSTASSVPSTMSTSAPTAVTTPNTATPNNPITTNTDGSAFLNTDNLTKRNVADNETVQGQLGTMLNSNSTYMNAAQEGAKQQANKSGLLNSSLAATAGQKAAIEAALPVATADAAKYGAATDYNTALTNQGTLKNTETQNTFATAQNLAGTQEATQGRTIEAEKATQERSIVANMSTAQLQAATSKYATDKQAETSRYNTDATFAQDQYKYEMTLADNIIKNTELSPDRKNALLIELGHPELAKAIWVYDSVRDDLYQPYAAGGSTASTDNTDVR